MSREDVKTIDLTPTWESIALSLAAVLEGGAPRWEARAALARMGAGLDFINSKIESDSTGQRLLLMKQPELVELSAILNGS